LLLLLALVGAEASLEHRESRRRILQSGVSRQELLEWFRAADADKLAWPEMFSVDQDTKKEVVIGVVTENPWGTLCNSIAECA